MRLSHAFFSPVLVVALALVAGLQAGEIEGPKEAVPADQFVVLRYKLEKGDDLIWEVSPKPAKTLTYIESDYSYCVFNGPSDRKYEAKADLINWETKKRSKPTYDVIIGKAPVPPPVPPGPVPPGPNPPGPVPPDPAPVPVTSFYTILIYESGKGLTSAQNSVFNGVVVETWLRDKCTKDGQFNGFRRHDKDDATSGDTPTFNEMWGKAKAAIGPDTILPAIAMAVNGKITIDKLGATPTEQVKTLEKYLSGR